MNHPAHFRTTIPCEDCLGDGVVAALWNPWDDERCRECEGDGEVETMLTFSELDNGELWGCIHLEDLPAACAGLRAEYGHEELQRMRDELAAIDPNHRALAVMDRFLVPRIGGSHAGQAAE